MNLPNRLTLFRIFLVIPFLGFLIWATIAKSSSNLNDLGLLSQWQIALLVSGIIFALAMITDFLDGFLARKNKQITSFGKLFDPLADKFITTTALIFFAIIGIVPFYLVLGFILRDILVDGSRNVAAKNNINISASWYGKWKTFILSIGILVVFFALPFYNFNLDLISPGWETWLLILPILIALLLSTISGFFYFKAIIPFLKNK